MSKDILSGRVPRDQQEVLVVYVQIRTTRSFGSVTTCSDYDLDSSLLGMMEDEKEHGFYSCFRAV